MVAPAGHAWTLVWVPDRQRGAGGHQLLRGRQPPVLSGAAPCLGPLSSGPRFGGPARTCRRPGQLPCRRALRLRGREQNTARRGKASCLAEPGLTSST